MSAQILDGLAYSKQVRQQTLEVIKGLSRPPELGIIVVGQDPRSAVYVRNKQRAATEVGIQCHVCPCCAEISTTGLIHVMGSNNKHPAIDGYIVQLPLPAHIDLDVVANGVDPEKDVDGFHPLNQGLLLRGSPRFVPATPRGIIELLKHNGCTISGKRVVILGRSTIVGRPLAAALLLNGALGDATVTVAHTKTEHLQEVCREADILVVAIGRPRFVTSDFVRQGAVVVDVGINKTNGGLCGDVDFASVKEVASAITPVPGGIGPMTIAMLLKNTLESCQRRTMRGK